MSNSRRPIQARDTKWASSAARFLYGIGATPNVISLASVAFAALAGACIAVSSQYVRGDSLLNVLPTWAWLVLGAVFVQCRLLCNLFDGMVAIEFGLKSKSGELFNDVPDRPADVFILIGAGYSLSALEWGSDVGWIAAVLAVLTAYVRVLGVAAGTTSYFIGPMAKQHRMATVTVACLLTAVERSLWYTDYVMTIALSLIALGSAVTVGRRLRRIYVDLEGRI